MVSGTRASKLSMKLRGSRAVAPKGSVTFAFIQRKKEKERNKQTNKQTNKERNK